MMEGIIKNLEQPTFKKARINDPGSVFKCQLN